MRRLMTLVLIACVTLASDLSTSGHVPTYSNVELQVRSNFCVNGPAFNLPCNHFFANATPAFNDIGQMAIKLDVIPGGNEGFQGIWFGQNASGAIEFTSQDGAILSDPTMNNAGYVVFPQTFSSSNGLYFYDSVVDMSGLRTTLPFGTTTWASAKVNDAGQIGYRASFSGSGQAHYSLEGASMLALHAAEAGLDPQSAFSFLFSPAFNNSRQMASVVRLGAAGQTGNSQPDQVRIFNSDGSSVIVAHDRDSDVNSPFSSFDSTRPGFNNVGQVAFAASLVGGGRGVFLGDSNGNITTIATTFTPSVTVIDFFGPSVNDHGLVAFRGRDGTLPTSRYAIFVGDGTMLRRVIGQFDPVMTDLGTGQIAQHDSSNVFGGAVTINARGDVAFHCGLTPAGNNQVEWGSGMFIARADVNPADLNHDGSVGVPDLLAVINSWGPCLPAPAACPADIAPNGGDGVVGVPDLLAVINNWGS